MFFHDLPSQVCVSLDVFFSQKSHFLCVFEDVVTQNTCFCAAEEPRTMDGNRGRQPPVSLIILESEPYHARSTLREKDVVAP